MTGWRWCPGATGRCAECGKLVTGLWMHYVSQTTASLAVCADCAGGGG